MRRLEKIISFKLFFIKIKLDQINFLFFSNFLKEYLFYSLLIHKTKGSYINQIRNFLFFFQTSFM